MKRVAIHQPHYFPWLGLLHKIAQSDVFIVLDNVQFNRQDYQHRSMYSTQTGAKWLTIPVGESNRDTTEICAIHYGTTPERVYGQHFKTLQFRYGKAPGWKQTADRLRQVFDCPEGQGWGYGTMTPMQLIMDSMKLTLDLFGINTPMVFASSLDVTGKKDELMLNLTRAVGGDVYLSGTGARSYLRESLFTDVKLEWQAFEHPIYPQRHLGAFVRGCMGLDFYLEDAETAQQYANLWSQNENPCRLAARRR